LVEYAIGAGEVELRIFLPKSHQALLSNFKQALLAKSWSAMGSQSPYEVRERRTSHACSCGQTRRCFASAR